jgi:alpha-galactosidase
MYGQRNIACVLDFCKDIREVASKNALFINYANPMAMNTWAAQAYGKVNTIGLCHGVEAGWHILAQALGGQTQDINGVCAGINHQTWYTQVLFKGKPVSAEKLVKALESHPKYSKTEKCRIDVLKRFGCFSTESNGHLSEYLPWYRKRPKELKKWISLDTWIHGETGGYLRVCTEGRSWFESDFPRWLKAEDKPISAADRSHERGSYIIEALETGRPLRTYVNTRNNHTITNLAPDAIIEAPCYIDKLGIHLPPVGDLPLACAATCEASINVQRMAVEAAVHGDVTLLKQAMLHDPLVGAVCNPEEVWQMTDEMLVAQAQWLPQYKKAIPAAKKRLAKKAVKTRDYAGAARLKVKSVAEMRRAYGKLEVDAAKRDNIKTKGAKQLK